MGPPPRHHRVMSQELLTLTEARAGVLTTRDATRLDVDANALARLVRSHAIVRVRRGAFVLGPMWDAARPEERLALRTRAVLRSRQDREEAASHQSALAVHGLPLFGMPLDVVDVCGRVGRVRRRAGLRIHRAVDGLELDDVDGCRAVPLHVALAQVAHREGRDPFVVATDRALACGRVDARQVEASLQRLAESPREALRAARWLGLVDAASESVGETRTRLLLHDLGHPARSQVRIVDGSGVVVARVDHLVDERVVVEFDGLVKYAGAEGRDALAAEKAREDLLRSLGYEVVRLTWADLDRPQRVDALVRAARDRARARAQR
jgi:hypothetical protein